MMKRNYLKPGYRVIDMTSEGVMVSNMSANSGKTTNVVWTHKKEDDCNTFGPHPIWGEEE